MTDTPMTPDREQRIRRARTRCEAVRFETEDERPLHVWGPSQYPEKEMCQRCTVMRVWAEDTDADDVVLLAEVDRMRAQLAELEAARPSRFSATPAQIDTFLRAILAEDTYLGFQQAIGAHVLEEAVEDAGTVRASADNDGLYSADWREGWDDAIERVDPDRNGPCPTELIQFGEAIS
ncbi:hypothetical protein [Streptomyces cyaneofuscatus]|uniref:hypothetical protein n=1 Tax=Streptomyces cyaneofuscatus TaxID=66883 RepID=UPI0036DFAC92